MSQIFKNILEEAFSFNKKTEVPKEETPTEETPTEEIPAEETTEDPADEEQIVDDEEAIEEYTIQSQLQDLCFSILDAIEAESLANGEVVEDNESIDIATELIAKHAKDFPDTVAQEMYDTLSQYFEMDVDETPEEDEEDFFEPKEEENEEEYEEDKPATEVKG